MSRLAVADTGFVVAVANQQDRLHAICKQQWTRETMMYLPQSVLAEVAYLLARGGGNHAVAAFLDGITRGMTKYRLISLEQPDLIRTAQLLHKYADSRLDFVDATVIAIAERLNITLILTIDKRDFGMVRPTHADAFDLLP